MTETNRPEAIFQKHIADYLQNRHGYTCLVRHEVAKMSCFSDEETTYATG